MWSKVEGQMSKGTQGSGSQLLLSSLKTAAGFLSKRRLIAINCLHLAAQVQSLPDGVAGLKTGASRPKLNPSFIQRVDGNYR